MERLSDVDLGITLLQLRRAEVALRQVAPAAEPHLPALIAPALTGGIGEGIPGPIPA